MYTVALIVIGLSANGDQVFSEKVNGYTTVAACLQGAANLKEDTNKVSANKFYANGKLVAVLQFNCAEGTK